MRVVDVTDDRDWMDEFPPESPPESRLLAGAATLPIITSKPPSGRTTRRRRVHRSILLPVSATLLLISASTAILGLRTRAALAPVPMAEWPVAPPPLSSPAAKGSPTPATQAPEVGPQPTPGPASEPAAAAASAPAAPGRSTPARIAPSAARTQAPPVAAEPPVPSGASDVSAILSVLERYRQAFPSLNPGSVRAIAFDNCRIEVRGVQADAVCAGRVSLVTRAGSQARNIQPRRWTFTLVHDRDAWRIQTVDRQ